MINALLGVSLIFMLLILSEFLWRTKRLRGERARKLIHIVAGILIAFWPWFISFEAIRIISLGMIVVILLSRKFNIFQGIHGVQRKTFGDILFPITVGLIASFAASKWVFAAALLHLGLADGMAAVAGDRWGKKNRYKVFGETKSLAGSFAFLCFSILIMMGLIISGPNDFGDFYLPLLVLVPIISTCVENLSVRGTDNIFVPLVVTIMLNQVAALSLLLY